MQGESRHQLASLPQEEKLEAELKAAGFEASLRVMCDLIESHIEGVAPPPGGAVPSAASSDAATTVVVSMVAVPPPQPQ